MAKRRKVGNPMALMVMATLAERPMHPYEMARVWRERGQESNWDIKWGSLYTVVNNLEKHGLIEVTDTVRDGRRPERTIYTITPEGRDEMEDWLEELVTVPEREFPRFASALSLLGIIPPDEAIRMLERRLKLLRMDNAARRAGLTEIAREVPRLFLIEEEYSIALAEAEEVWIVDLLEQLGSGDLPGVKEWRHFHDSRDLHPSLLKGEAQGD